MTPLKKALIASLIFHVVIFLFVIFGAKLHPFQRDIPPPPMILDFVRIAEKTSAPKLSPMSKNPAPMEPKTDQKPEIKPDPQKPLPEPKKVEPKVEPKKPEPPQSIKPDPIKPPKPVEKKIPKEEILIKKEEKKPPKKEQTPAPSPRKALKDLLKHKKAPAGEQGVPAETVSSEVTASEIDAIRQKIYQCWSIPAGIRDAKDMVVDVTLKVDKNGYVKAAEADDKSRIHKDPAFRSAAESAVRAVRDPQCNPLPIPKDKYEQFKEFTMVFNPKDMF